MSLGCGFSFRGKYTHELFTSPQAPDMLEVIADNHLFGDSFELAQELAGRYPIGLHCIGLNLGGTAPIAQAYVNHLRELIQATRPRIVSDHIAFTAVGGRFHHDLWPMPRNLDAVQHLVERIDNVQQMLGRRIHVENISAYVRGELDQMDEGTFLSELVERSGCGLILDLNNLWVNECNHGEPACDVVDYIDPDSVGYVHLAGVQAREDVIVDTHDATPSPSVWGLLDRWSARVSEPSVVIEWDDDLPEFDVMMALVRKAQAVSAKAAA